jgi:hypothetical protein
MARVLTIAEEERAAEPGARIPGGGTHAHCEPDKGYLGPAGAWRLRAPSRAQAIVRRGGRSVHRPPHHRCQLGGQPPPSGRTTGSPASGAERRRPTRARRRA